jgi:hypothetical protein
VHLPAEFDPLQALALDTTDDSPCPRPCENAREPRTRSIVFSLVFLRWRSSVFFVFRADDIEKDFLCAIRELGFLHSLAPLPSSPDALRPAQREDTAYVSRLGGGSDTASTHSS